MSERTDHPPRPDDDSDRGKAARRAVIGGIAGIALLVGPVILANAVVPGDDESDVVEASAAESETSLVALRQTEAEADVARANGQASFRTTTTPPPPTTSTTEAPPTTPPPTTPTTEAPTTTTTEAPPPPTPVENPAPPDTGGGFGDPGDYATWDALAQCESGGNWSINTGNGYYGGLQFGLSTWQSVGGTGLPSDHSRETQIHFGQILQARSGWGQWPHCSSKLGLR